MIRQWLDERGIAWNHTKVDRGWRAWMYIKNLITEIEIYLLPRALHTHFGINLSGGDTGRRVTISCGIKRLFDFYVSLDHPWLEKVAPGKWRDSTIRPGEKVKDPRETFIGVRIFDGTIWVSLWENVMEWRQSDPWWWAFEIPLLDLLLGAEQIERTDLYTTEATLILPEGAYAVLMSFYDLTWRRPRLPFTKRARKADVEFRTPVPIPGKGMGDDEISSMSVQAEGAHEALLALLNEINRCRIKYAGPNWTPNVRRGQNSGGTND